MPTTNQLVKKGRSKRNKKSKAIALKENFNSLKRRYLKVNNPLKRGFKRNKGLILFS